MSSPTRSESKYAHWRTEVSELPPLSLQQQRDAILTITSILQRLESREQLELIHRFRSNVVEYAKALPWVAEAFAESGIAP